MKITNVRIMWAALFLVAGAQADSVTHGGTTINMDFVDIGDGGALGDPLAGGANSADGTGYGSVGYNYRIGKFEVTAAQWDAVRLADPNVGNAGLYSGSQPIAVVSWLEAAKFSNWLTSGSYNNGAYQFSDPNTLTGVDRDAAVATYGMAYVLPSEDEWYKAAYFKSNGSGYTLYATGDSVPGAGTDTRYGGESSPWNVGTGLLENNGTYDMSGNVVELIESAYDGTLNNLNENRVIRGGGYWQNEDDQRSSFRSLASLTGVGAGLGFRVAAIPEPSSILLMGAAGGFAVFIRRRFRR